MPEPPGRPGHRSPGTPGERWSFGGATAIETAEGVLLPEALIAGPHQAALHARWRSRSVPAASFHELPELSDVTVVDDRGNKGALRAEAMSSGSDLPAQTGWPMTLRLGLDPVPRRGTRWLELRGGNGTATRLLPSMWTTVRVGRLTPAAAGSLPAGWSGPLAPAARRDGPRRHLDLGGALPPIAGVTVRADSLFSWPGSWKLYLRAGPGWWKYAGDRSHKWSPISVTAEDDRGGRYVSSFGGSTRHQDHEELVLQFLPGLDPLALGLTLTFRGAREEVSVALGLGTIAGSQAQ
jgi:hypothetical protein